jgi:hypothetical protein
MMTQKTKFEIERERALIEARVAKHMKKMYTARKLELLKELTMLNELLRKL